MELLRAPLNSEDSFIYSVHLYRQDLISSAQDAIKNPVLGWFVFEQLLENPDTDRGRLDFVISFWKNVDVHAHLHALVPLPGPEGPAGRYGLAAACLCEILNFKNPIMKKKREVLS